MPEDPGRTRRSSGEGLSKAEILRGHDAYRKVLNAPAVFSGKHLKMLLLFQDSDKKFKPKSPPDTSIVRVGFLVAKKKIRKASLRNRIRRLLKEQYRRQKSIIQNSETDISLIITLTNHGYDAFLQDPKLKSQSLTDDMLQLINLASNYLKSN